MNATRLALLALGLVLGSGVCDSREAADEPRMTQPRQMAVVPLAVPSDADASPGDAAPAPRPEAKTPRGNPLWAIPLRTLSVTRERPLFSASRRPPAPVAAAPPEPVPQPVQVAAPAPEPERPPLTLSGTITSPGHSIAIVLNKTTNQVTRVREGEREAGWKVTSVAPRSAVFEKDGRLVTLDLPAPGNEPGAASALDAPAPGLAPGLLPQVNDGAL